MKRIKTKDIDPTKLVTKKRYADNNKTNPTNVQRMINRGKLTVIVVDGGELIHL